MSYADFGLDDVKTSTEAGKTEPLFYCPWTRYQVSGRNFYLCFSNWVVSRTAIAAFTRQAPEVADEADQCIKCNQRVSHLHYSAEGFVFEEGVRIGICPDCLTMAASYITRFNSDQDSS